MNDSEFLPPRYHQPGCQWVIDDTWGALPAALRGPGRRRVCRPRRRGSESVLPVPAGLAGARRRPAAAAAAGCRPLSRRSDPGPMRRSARSRTQAGSAAERPGVKPEGWLLTSACAFSIPFTASLPRTGPGPARATGGSLSSICRRLQGGNLKFAAIPKCPGLECLTRWPPAGPAAALPESRPGAQAARDSAWQAQSSMSRCDRDAAGPPGCHDDSPADLRRAVPT